MKHILKYTLGLAGILSLGSCLKDKGFDNGTYGINGADKGAIITMSAAQNKINGVGVDYVTTSQTVTLSGISFDADQPTSKDINVVTALTAAPVTAWNADPNRPYDLTPMPASLYQIANATVKIVAGQRIADLKITIPNAQLMDVNLTYGLAVTIVSNDAGTTISGNMKTALFAISAKNKYDGVYAFRGRIDVQPDRPTTFFNGVYDYPYEIYLITAGPTGVKFYNTAFGLGYHPLINNGGVSGFSQTEPNLVFDAATDALQSVSNTYTPLTNGRGFIMNTAVTTSRYDAGTKKVYAAIKMTQPTFLDLPCYDTLTFLRGR